MNVSSPISKPQVTAEDQELINRFARLHQKSTELSEKLRSRTTEVNNLIDASDELLLLDEEDTARIPFKIGSVFVMYDQESMEKRLDKMRKELNMEISATTELNDKLQSEMAELKSRLYAKFGDNINLETEKDD
uniref:Prefoldin subunit 4 n=2 Tax=Parascaris univalens TaxID=6257 RepID=A0A915AU62_PARUN